MRTIRSPKDRALSGAERGAVAALAVVTLAGCDDGGFGGRTALNVGDPAPPSLELSGRGPALIWTFHSADCLTCNLAQSSWVARRLQHRSSRSLETIVVAVGGRDGSDRRAGSDQDMVAGYLASERIEAAIHMRTPEQYAKEFGRAATLPALYLVGGDGDVEATVPDPDAPGVPDWESYDLHEVLLRLARTVDGSEQPNNSNPTRKENQP